MELTQALDELFKPRAEPPPAFGDTEVTALLRRAVTLDASDLLGEYERLPSQVAFANMMFADADRRVKQAELNAKALSARKYSALRESKRESRMTESAITAGLEGDAEWQNCQIKLMEALYERTRLRAVVLSLEAKRDMLISLGAHKRLEHATYGAQKRPRSMTDEETTADY